MYYRRNGIDVIAPQAAGYASTDHDFWRGTGMITRDLVMKACADGEGNNGDGNGRSTDPSVRIPSILLLLPDE